VSDKEQIALPDGWIAPRKEFCVLGFNCEHHFFRFDAAVIPIPPPEARIHGMTYEESPGAKCHECGSVMNPERSTLVDHAKLHLAVKLAKEEILAAR
jgi:hypothetical protein